METPRSRCLARKFFYLWAKKTFGQDLSKARVCRTERRRRSQSHAPHRMDVLSLQFWAQSLQSRAWLQWRELYLYRQHEKQEARAVTHHQHWALKRCMEAWLEYLNLQRTKKMQHELAQEHHQSRTVQQFFSEWQHSWSRRMMQTHQEDMAALAARSALKRVFAHWKHTVPCVEQTPGRELADKHYRHHLLKLGLKGLWQNVLSTRVKQRRKTLADHQHAVTVLHKFWNHWKARLEEKEEQQKALTSMACAHYRRVLLRGVFGRWLLNTQKQQEQQAAEEGRRGQPVSGHKGAHSQDSQEDSAEKLLPTLEPHLLSPENLVGQGSHQTAAEVEKRERGSREDPVFHRELAAELQHIQEQMQYCYSRKQELGCCLQQAQILQKWLGVGMQPEGLDGAQLQEELNQLQGRISALRGAQGRERRLVQKLSARLRDLQAALQLPGSSTPFPAPGHTPCPAVAQGAATDGYSH